VPSPDDPSSVYYWNQETDETAWDLPVGLAISAEVAQPPASTTPGSAAGAGALTGSQSAKAAWLAKTDDTKKEEKSGSLYTAPSVGDDDDPDVNPFLEPSAGRGSSGSARERSSSGGSYADYMARKGNVAA
jgi:hypothetical protein